jgi:hypothetical protein
LEHRFIQVKADQIIVGHEAPQATDPFAKKEQETWDVCSNTILCEKLKAYDATQQGVITNKWVHLAVVRTATAGSCPVLSFSYTVYINGISLGTKGPLCGGERGDGLMASKAYMLFGAMRPGSRGQNEYFDGILAEWRVWNGVRLQNKIVSRMLTRIRPETIPLLGDETEGTITASTYPSSAVLLALYDFTFPCLSAVCEVKNMEPLFPIPAVGKELLTLESFGGVQTAETDSSGVMFWQSAADMALGVTSNGLVTLSPSKGQGLYQMTIYISYAGGAGRVPVDFIVNVVEQVLDAGTSAYRLCAGSAPCNWVGNQYAPQLMVLGDVVPRGPCDALYRRPSDVTTGTDMQQFLYPCSISAYAGYEMQLTVVGDDMQPDALNTMVRCTHINMHVHTYV